MTRKHRTLGGVLATLLSLGLAATTAHAAPTPTPTSTRKATARADFTSYDDRVIFQSFSLFQPYESTMYAKLGAQTSLLNSWGVTDVWLPPAYRSFGMARYMEGYAVADRYDLGEFPQGPNGSVATKYGTAAELKAMMTRLHNANLKAQVDLVPNQMMGLTGREAVTATRTDMHGNTYVTKDGVRTGFVNQVYLPHTQGGGTGQATYGAIKQFTKDHWNGTSLQQLGYGDTLKDASGRPYRVDQPNAADNNVPTWLNPALGHNTVEGYLSSRDAYELSPGNWRPYLVNDPAFVRYATARCGFADEAAVKTGRGDKAIWDCRADFIDQKNTGSDPLALPGAKYNYWGEEPSVDNSVTGIDWPDQIRFAGHNSINIGIAPQEEFLVGNDFDTSRKDVQDEQRHWVRWLLDTYGFDGFRVDAAAHYDTAILDMVAQETAKKFGGDPSRYLNYLETYNQAAVNAYVDRAQNSELAYDAQLFFTLNDAMAGRQPVSRVWQESGANVSGDRATSGTYRPNWSFVSNHDQEKNRINAVMLEQLGLREGGCTGGPTACRSLNVEWNAAAQAKAVAEWNADLARPSSAKTSSPKNVPAMYAVVLTNKATTPQVFYGDMFRTDGGYMAEKTPYYDEIEALLKARKAYAKGDQRAFAFGDDTGASVRFGNDRASGLATVISTNPTVNKDVTVSMGRDHTNQAFRDVTGKSSQVLVTDGQGNLTVPVRGSDNTAEVSGYLGVWAPVDTTVQKVTHGAIDAKWQESRAILGAPTSGENCFLRDGGCFQTFQNGSIYWSPATGAHWTRGTIREKWGQLGWETGYLGYPTSDEFCGLRDGGCGQRFQGGLMLWTPSTGAHAVRGLILDEYAAQGWENSRLGYPTSDEFCGLRDGGCASRFQGGLIYWTPATGAHTVLGAIGDAYARQGWETGSLGYPVGNEFCGLRDGGCAQRFQGGMIYWSPASGPQVVKGRILDAYASQRWETGRLGYPTTWERCDANGCVQDFQGGRITWNLRDGARITYR